MIWLTWRQFRGQALVTAAALALFTAYLVYLGLEIRDSYGANVDCGTACPVGDARQAFENQYSTPIQLLGLVILVAPALVGAFWGAPLIAREIEGGTHRLVWNQSVTRRRWLAAKMACVVLAGVAAAAALSVLLTWAASPYDSLIGDRFDALTFPARNITPLGYALFAVVAGAVIGLVVRRTVLAMAITLAVCAVLQVVFSSLVRPNLRTPVTETVTFSEEMATSEGFDSLGVGPDGMEIQGVSLPGAWVLTDTSQVLDSAGNKVTSADVEGCMRGDPRKDMACLASKDLHFSLKYHPADRYWTFQWLELGSYVALAGLLAGFAFWRIRRGIN